MATILLPNLLPSLPPLPFQQPSPCHSLAKNVVKSRSRNIFVSCCSSSLRDPVPIMAQDSSSSFEDTLFTELVAADGIDGSPNFRGCKTCGREEIVKRCNGEGRIQGGIATIRGFGWWPIKAFKPCPGFVASGGRYRRHGQSLDEVAFGRTERDISVKLKAMSTRMNQGPRKLKE
ncbi:uncharacterized protein LOC110104272 isoform X1 [Dendrobium catenatum]|nr:uncharacterized protein LOC110104272 isoform X1 [Dendrobium catenatum]